MFIRRSHGCMKESVLPSPEMRKYARSGWRKKSRMGIASPDCPKAAGVATPGDITKPAKDSSLLMFTIPCDDAQRPVDRQRAGDSKGAARCAPRRAAESPAARRSARQPHSHDG